MKALLILTLTASLLGCTRAPQPLSAAGIDAHTRIGDPVVIMGGHTKVYDFVLEGGIRCVLAHSRYDGGVAIDCDWR